MRQARGREMAKVLLIGNWKGTLPVKTRQRQSMLPAVRALRESQHCVVGVEEPPEELFVR